MPERVVATLSEETGSQAGTLYLVHVLTHASRARLDEALGTLEVSAFQFTLLSVIGSVGGLFASQLSRRFHVTPQAMGETILLLEGRGLISRHEDAVRRRVLRLGLTEEGAEVVQAGGAVVAAFEREIFTGVSRVELATLRRVLTSALSVLREGG